MFYALISETCCTIHTIRKQLCTKNVSIPKPNKKGEKIMYQASSKRAIIPTGFCKKIYNLAITVKYEQ